MNQGPDYAPTIRLTCLTESECVIYLEPWGTEHILARGKVFEVSSTAFATGDVEVSYVTGGISIAFTSDVPVTVTDDAGRTLSI